MLVWASPATGLPLVDTDALDQLEILAVEAGDPTRVLFAAPARLVTETLTSDDIVATVDGVPQPVRLQRLSATDVEVAVVVDTTLGPDELRTLQGAVVELALDLPPGATMRVIGADGIAMQPAPVPGPAIAQIRQLRPDSEGDIRAAVDEATRLLAGSTQDRAALLVVGRDLDRRINPIDDLPVETATAYVVSVGAGGEDTLLGPRTAGAVSVVDEMAGILPATDEMANDLRNLYRAEIGTPDAAAQTLTLEVPVAGEDVPARTVVLDPDSVRPIDTDSAGAQPDAAVAADAPPPSDAQPAGTDSETAPRWLSAAAVIVLLLSLLIAGTQLLRRRVRHGPEPPPDDPPRVASGTARAPRHATSATRPIAKLTPQTREALAHAHLGLRQLALASRAVADSVPDEMFRLTEARASVALSGRAVTLHDVLVADLSQTDRTDDVELVRRAASALSTGWQHTARRRSAPPPVVEINAVLTGGAASGTTGPQRPIAPVRALNPLVEIGLEHVVLSHRDGRDDQLVARAVTAVDIMRAARLARPVLTLSPQLLDEARRYRAALNADLHDAAQRDRWLQLLCDCVAQGAAENADRLKRLGGLRERWRERADHAGVLPLIDLTLARPILDADLVARRLTVSGDAARRLLVTAAEAGWLQPERELTDTWVCDQVLTLFTRSTEDREPSSQPV